MVAAGSSAAAAGLLLLGALCGVEGSVYSRFVSLKHETYVQWSEGPMFSSSSFPSGQAYIEMKFNFSTQIPPGVRAAASVVHLSPGDSLGDNECAYIDQQWKAPYQQKFFLFNSTVKDNSTSLVPASLGGKDAEVIFEVTKEGLQLVVLSICTDYALITMNADAQLKFHNPYGWLPASWYGQVVVSGLVFALSGLLDLIFLFLFCKHRSTTIWLQWLILPVLLIMTVEALTTFVGFLEINSSGVPVCCPTPDTLYAGTLLYVFLRTAGRVLILIIGLGYGVVRPKLTCREILLVTALGVFYAVAGLLVQIQIYIIQASPEVDSSQDVYQQWQLLELFANAWFAIWIYTAIRNTRAQLRQKNQKAKTQMYNWLYRIYITYITVACLFLLIDLGINGYFFDFDQQAYWKFAWLSSLQKLFLFLVIAAICSIWRPSPVSYMYAYSQELPTSEKDADETGGATAIEVHAMTPEKIKLDISPEEGDPNFKIADEEDHEASPSEKPSSPPSLHARESGGLLAGGKKEKTDAL